MNRQSNASPFPSGAGLTAESGLPGATAAPLPGLGAAESKALRITTTFETGRPLTFARWVGDFDGAGLSFGILQWNIGSGTLQPMLLEFDRDHPERFTAVFGPHADVLRNVLRQSKDEQLRFARSINDQRYRIVEPWATYLKRLGDDPAFQRIQLRKAGDRMRVAADYVRHFGLRTERALALMFDTVTQNGGAWLRVKNRRALIEQRRAAQEQQLGRPLTERELLAVIAGVLADTVRPEYREDVLGRRMMIVNGQGVRGGRFFDLGREFGLGDQPLGQPGAAPSQVAASTPVASPPTELTAVRLAVLRGMRDPNQLTDLVFYQRHPDRRGRPLGRRDRGLVREWLTIRATLVEPALRALATGALGPATGAAMPEVSFEDMEQELDRERGGRPGGVAARPLARTWGVSMAPLRAQRFLPTRAFARHYAQQLAARHRPFDPRAFARRFYRARRRRWPRWPWPRYPRYPYGGAYPYPYEPPIYDYVAYVDGIPILYRRVGDRVILIDALDPAALPDIGIEGGDGAIPPENAP